MNKALIWLASFRLRILFRTAFLALALAVVAMAVTVLQEEKQRSYDNYRTTLLKTKAQILASLHHPAGQLALLNPDYDATAARYGQPVVLPYSAIDFDDQNKVRNAVEMAGCLIQYPAGGSLCVGIGNNPWAGGFIYAAGTFSAPLLVAHRIGDEVLDNAHRLRVTAQVRGQTYRWLAPFEPLPTSGRKEGVRGRFTGYVEQEGRNYHGARPVREFRGWVWQDSACVEAGASVATTSETCSHTAFFSVRLPVEVLSQALFAQEKPVWPPNDLADFRVRVELLSPGEADEPVFDSDSPGAVAPFTLKTLGDLLLPGESLWIRRVEGSKTLPLIQLNGQDEALEASSPWLTKLIRRLPVESPEAPIVELQDDVVTPLGNYQILLKGDARSVSKVISAVATRVSWFVGAMLAAIGLAWLVIEMGLIRRIARLTRRTRGLSSRVYAEGGLEAYDLSDLRGRDELGILATGLDELLRRVKEDVEREKIRAEQEKETWHAVGHEIMSPLQSLLALHGRADDPSHRYIRRMQQAVRVLYGQASPSEAFESSRMTLSPLNILEFVQHIVENAGIDAVNYVGPAGAWWVRADEFPLEDVFAHVLKNADRYRVPASPILIDLVAGDHVVNIRIQNTGPSISESLLSRIFEYGVSDQEAPGKAGHRGQGLFVAKTYMAKMGGTITAHNLPDGVVFELGLQRVTQS